MKKLFLAGIAIFCMFSFVMAEGGPYELTKVDIFSLKVNLSGSDIALYGVTIKTPLNEALTILKKTQADITSSGKYNFLEIEPGAKLRISGDKIEALLVSEKFKAKLIGATAKLFDNIDTEDNFKAYVTKYFLKPDNYDSSSVAGFESNTITYLSGFEFVRFNSREGATCTICFKGYGL